MNFDKMLKLYQEDPKQFEAESERLQQENIKDMCNGDERCEWRLNGLLFRINKEASEYINPVARLNFVISRFYTFIRDNYGNK